MILSVCIPSYNRVETLLRLLDSIDERYKDDVEVVICEDESPRRSEINKAVNAFINQSKLTVRYYENPHNYGYDKNLRVLTSLAQGHFVVFMGDDDYFIKENFGEYISFLKCNKEKGYILKTWVCLHEDGWEEPFNYFQGRKSFEPGIEALVKLYRLSTFVSGFTFNREYSQTYLIDTFDATLLFQLYLLGELTLKYPSVFYEIPIVIQTEKKVDVPYFGSAQIEKNLYTPGEITIKNSINFLKGYYKISEFLDSKYDINVSSGIRKDMSKHSYSYLFLHRDKGIRSFSNFYKTLINEIGLGDTIHIHIYYYSLLILGKKWCNIFIHLIKRVFRRTF